MPIPRTVTFKSVLHGVQYRLGGSPDDLGVGTAHAIGEYIQSAYKSAWKHYEWPDVCRVEQFTADANGLISDADIETPFLVTLRDPRVDQNPGPIKHTCYREGFYLPAAYKSAAVWVTYRPICPTFTGVEYDASETYPVGASVYWPESGQCYVCIQQATVFQPPDDTDHWAEQEFLESLSEAVKEGAFAAMTREEGQAQTALLIKEAMAELLLDEIERLEMQAGQYRLIRVDIP